MKTRRIQRYTGAVCAAIVSMAVLTACGSEAQKGEFPNYGKNEAFNLTVSDDFSDFIQEYGELPDDFIEVTTSDIDRESGLRIEDLSQLTEAGETVCSSDHLLEFLKVSSRLYYKAEQDPEDADVSEEFEYVSDIDKDDLIKDVEDFGDIVNINTDLRWT